MPGLGDIVQKAFYLGVGLASYAGQNLQEIRTQAQKLADEMVERGEMTAKEARQYVEELMQQAQQEATQQQKRDTQANEPRFIEVEVIDDDETAETPSTEKKENADDLRQQVEALQEELRKLKRD